ncbi:MAG: BMC domain-containing protein [Acidaminococcales bacterium]|jgi:microcompartment protein CcmL/EutN|nr:BMC domain-containing protein [Acidaminococcales bacterium]
MGAVAAGLLETRGLADALEALDAMLKAAGVRLCLMKRVGSGVVAIVVKGEVAAVEAAVEAGARKVLAEGGTLLCSYVIANPHPALRKYLIGEAKIIE